MIRTFIAFAIAGVLSLSACEDEVASAKTCNPGTLATVKDLRGLDGCGFVFELADGTRLLPTPLLVVCFAPSNESEQIVDPLVNFEFIDGKQVRISYEEVTDMANICMTGKMVKITCIEEIKVTE